MKLAVLAAFALMPFGIAIATRPHIPEPESEIEFPRLFPLGSELPANPTLVYDRGGVGDTVDVVVESDGHPVRFRATKRDTYIQLDIALANGPLEVRIQEGTEVRAEFRARSTTTRSYQVGSSRALSHTQLTVSPLGIETDAIIQRMEWDDGAVEPWFMPASWESIDQLLSGSDSGVAKRFRLVGVFVDGRTETILESVHLGAGVAPLGLTAGEPVSGRTFAGLVICLLFGLVDFRRFARAL